MNDREVQEAVDKLKAAFGGKGKGLILAAFVIFFVIPTIWGGFYTVDAKDVGVVTRFGAFSHIAEPGLQFKLPWVDDVKHVPTGRVLKEEFGFRTERADVKSKYSEKDHLNESVQVSGDLNMVDVMWILQYQITDPVKWLFEAKSPVETIRDLSEANIREVVGNATMEDVLTVRRAELAQIASKALQEDLDRLDIGVGNVNIKFQDCTPPGAVKGAWNEVNEAEQQKESKIFQAREKYNQEVPKARGVADKTIQEAEGYATERVNLAKGETNRFLALLKEYKKAPKVTKRRIYIETMRQVLPQVEELWLIDSDGNSSPVPLLPLRNLAGQATTK